MMAHTCRLRAPQDEAIGQAEIYVEGGRERREGGKKELNMTNM